MIEKLRIYMLASILIISTLFVGWPFGPGMDMAGAEDVRGTGPSTSPESNDDIFWDRIRLISEPVEGQNQNDLNSYHAKIAVEGENIYVVWADETDYQGSNIDADIFFRYYNGTNWSSPEIISEPVQGSNINENASTYPDIAVENGNIYVVWEDQNDTDGTGGDSDIFYRENLSGAGWGFIQVISEPYLMGNNNTGNSYMPDIAVDNGNPFVVWQDTNDTDFSGTDNDIHYRKFFFGGGWGPIEVISEPDFGHNNAAGGGSQEPDIAVENGNIYVAWTDLNATNSSGTDPDIHYRPYYSGSGWDVIQVLSEPVADADTNKNYSDFASIAVEDGNVYVAWEDKNDTNGAGGNSDIFFRMCLPGTCWRDVQVISEPKVGEDSTDSDGSTPDIAVEDGNIYIVWESVNATDSSDIDSDIHYRFSATGNSWERIQVISEPALTGDINVGESEGPAIDVEFGKSHVVWYDDNVTYSSDTDQDIFYRTTLVAPTLTNFSVSPMYGNTSTVFNYTVTYADAENNAPFSIKVNIGGVNNTMLEADSGDTFYRDGKIYYFATMLNIADTHTYQFWADDGLFLKGTGIMDGPVVNNTPPVIITTDVTTAYEDMSYSVQYNYTDIDKANVGQVLSWEFDTDAAWLSLNAATGLLSGTPGADDNGTYFVNVTINDTIAIDFHYFMLEVFSVDDVPVMQNSTIANSTYEDEYYEVIINATDEDNNASALNWSIKTNAGWLEFNATSGILNGTPVNEDVGYYWVNISVSDGNNTVWKNFTVDVLNVNDPPEILTNDVITATAGQNYTVWYSAIDIDLPPQNLTWTFSTNAGPWLAFNETSQWLNGTPMDNDTGEYWVHISVYDTDNATDSQNFTLTVVKAPIPNKNPNIIGVDLTEGEVGNIYLSGYKATDDNTPATELKWTFATNATWLTFDNKSGELSGTPGDNDTGVFWVTIIVADDEGGLAIREFNITVIKPYIPPPPPNRAPVLKNGDMSPSSGDTDTTFTFTVHYSDEDGDEPDSITVVIDGTEYDMELSSGDAANGVYEYKIKLGTGEHSYYFTASDGTVPAATTDDTPLSSADAVTTPAVKEAKEDESNLLFIIIILLIVIVIVLVVVLAMRRKPKEKDEGGEEEEEEEEGGDKMPKLFKGEFDEEIIFGDEEDESAEDAEDEIPFEEGEDYIIEEDEEAAREMFEKETEAEDAEDSEGAEDAEEEVAEAEIVEAEEAEEAPVEEEPEEAPVEEPEAEAEEPSEEEMPEAEEEEEDLDDEDLLDDDELKEFEDMAKADSK